MTIEKSFWWLSGGRISVDIQPNIKKDNFYSIILNIFAARCFFTMYHTKKSIQKFSPYIFMHWWISNSISKLHIFHHFFFTGPKSGRHDINETSLVRRYNVARLFVVVRLRLHDGRTTDKKLLLGYLFNLMTIFAYKNLHTVENVVTYLVSGSMVIQTQLVTGQQLFLERNRV